MFNGTVTGRFVANHAVTGTKPWESPIGTGIIAAPIAKRLSRGARSASMPHRTIERRDGYDAAPFTAWAAFPAAVSVEPRRGVSPPAARASHQYLPARSCGSWIAR